MNYIRIWDPINVSCLRNAIDYKTLTVRGLSVLITASEMVTVAFGKSIIVKLYGKKALSDSTCPELAKNDKLKEEKKLSITAAVLILFRTYLQ